MPKKAQSKKTKQNLSDDPEELQFKDETNQKWVDEWKKAVKKK